jgi:uncharacterized phage protein (TIGR01671 family)
MREIKFRGKDCSGQWVYGDLIHKRHDKESVLIQDYTGLGSDVDTITIGQYTGLKDIHEKEIYEGDIVEWVFFYERLGANMGVIEDDTIVKGIIRWRQGGFVLEVIENDFEDAGYYSISALYTDTESDVEIIGNIYDNPELIKEEGK